MGQGPTFRILALNSLVGTSMLALSGCMNAELAWDTAYSIDDDTLADVVYAPDQLPAGAEFVIHSVSQVNVGECFGVEFKLQDADQSPFGLTTNATIGLYEANNQNIEIGLYTDSACAIALGNNGPPELTLAAGHGSYRLYMRVNEPANLLLGALIVGIPQLSATPVAVSSSVVNPPAAVRLIAGQMSPRGYVDSVMGGIARYNNITSIAVDSQFIYVADRDNRVIRKVVHDASGGTVGQSSTIAGVPAGQDSNCSNGPCDGAVGVGTMHNPMHLVYDSGRSALYFAEYCAVRKVDLTVGATYGQITTIAGSTQTCGEVDATGTSARFSQIISLAVSQEAGGVLFVGTTNPTDSKIRRISLADNSVTTLINGARAPNLQYLPVNGARPRAVYWADQNGANYDIFYLALDASMQVNSSINSGFPYSIGMGGGRLLALGKGYGPDDLFSMDWDSGTRRINYRILSLSSAVVPTIGVPNSGQSEFGNVNGSASVHALSNSIGGVVACGIYLCIADAGNHAIRRFDFTSQSMTTLSGSSAPVSYVPTFSSTTPSVVTFGYLEGAVRLGNSVYMINRERNTVQKASYTVGGGGAVTVSVNEEVSGARTVSGSPSYLSTIHTMAVAQDGAVYVVDATNTYTTRLVRFPPVTGTGTVLATFTWSSSMDPIRMSSIVLENAAQPSFAFLADRDHHAVYRINFAMSGSPIGEASRVVYGMPTQPGDYNNSVVPANVRFRMPATLAIHPNNSTVYVGDQGNHVIRAIQVSTDEVSTFAGVQYQNGGSNGNTSGPAAQATLDGIAALAANNQYLYFADEYRSRVFRLDFSTMEIVGLLSAGVAGDIDDSNGDPAIVKVAFPKFLSIDPVAAPSELMIGNEFNIRVMQ